MMDFYQPTEALSRRGFLTSTGGGIGLAALASLLAQESSQGASLSEQKSNAPPLGKPHYPATAKNCIFIYLYGGTSQIDLFDPKPKVNELDGQLMPASLADKLQFAFIKKDTAKFMASPQTFKPHGQCGMELSNLIPHLGTCANDLVLIRSMHTEAFNHQPGQILMNTGATMVGRPSVGAWLTYGLGSESSNLPGYIVLMQMDNDGVKPYSWSNGFLPSSHQGTRFFSKGQPVLNLANPAGVSTAIQRGELDAIRDLNAIRYRHVHDPEIAGRISAYELAFRMQAATPELLDTSQETSATLEAYGANRQDTDQSTFGKNCLLARRMVERGVRFVNLIHGNWDHHRDLYSDMPKKCLVVDQPIAALIKDLKQRGMLDSTLVVLCSEFGRTAVSDNGNKPDLPPNGRDHHPSAFSVLLAGGGTKGGQVIGKTDELGWNIVEDPVHINDLHATILHLFGLDHLKFTYRFKGRDFRLTDVGGKVVRKVLA
jgi:hypothetical protein